MHIRHQSGLSLVEILVTLGIIAILASVAAPNLQSLMEKNKVHALNDEFANSLYRVRSEAAKRGYDVTLCASNNTKTDCDNTATDFSNGWILFTDYDANGLLGAPTLMFDSDGDGSVDTAEEILFVSDTEAGSRYVLRFNGASSAEAAWRVRYRSNGLLRASGALMGRTYFVVDTQSAGEPDKARIAIGQTGRVRSCVGAASSCN